MRVTERRRLAWLLVLTALLTALAAVVGGSAQAAPSPGPQPGPLAASASAVPSTPSPAPVPSAGLAPSAGSTPPSDPVGGAPEVPTPSPGTAPDPNYTPPPPKPKPAPPPNGGLAPPADPSSQGGPSIFDIPGQIKAAITSLLASLLEPLVVPLMNALARLLLTTPDVTAMPRVAELWDGLRILACSLYVLFVLAAGILAMPHGTVQQRYAARDLVPRLCLGMFASNLSLFVCQHAITLVNAVSQAVFGNGVNASDLAGTMVNLLTMANGAPLYIVVVGTVVQTTGLVLFVTLLIRTAVVIVLVVAAPLMLACHGSPATEGVARMWWRAFAGVLMTQVIQSIVFLVCVKVILDPANYNMFGIPSMAALINLMLMCCTFYLLIKIPSWIRKLVTQPVQRSMGAGSGGGMHLLKKVALGAIGLPLGPYALGAQLAGRFGAGPALGRFSRGPVGPMQFELATFAEYDQPVPPGGATPPTPWDFVDAVYAASRLLCSAGGRAGRDLHTAVLTYNHDEGYASRVLALAATYALTSPSADALPPNQAAATAIAYARSQLGVPYVWGAQSPGVAWDCSALVQSAYASAGIRLPRTAQAQYDAAPHLPSGSPVLPGDLVFYGTGPTEVVHVAMTISPTTMVNAPRPGQNVKIDPIQTGQKIVGFTRPTTPVAPG